MSEKHNIKSRQKLKDARATAGLSVNGAAAATGLHRNTVLRLESGKMALTEEYAVRLSQAYGCMPGELIDGTPLLTQEEREIVGVVTQMSATERQLLSVVSQMTPEERAELLTEAAKIALRRAAAARSLEPSQ